MVCMEAFGKWSRESCESILRALLAVNQTQRRNAFKMKRKVEKVSLVSLNDHSEASKYIIEISS